MKTSFFSLTLFLLIGTLFSAVSCRNTSVTPTPAPMPAATGDLRVSTAFASQTTQFAFDLARQVSRREPSANNLFISPLSLHIALGMLLNGANGQTAQEIQKTLNLDAQTLADVNQTYQNLMVNLPLADPKVTMTLANSIWYRNTFTVENTYQDLLKQTFQAEVSAQDFNDPATVGKINAWASEKTNGKIPKVIDQIQSDNVLFLLNALYFKGKWKTQFDPESTTDAPFTLASGAQKTVRMMRLRTDVRRAFKSTYSAFELPYGDDKFAMTILVPTQNTTAEGLLATLTASDWTQLQAEMTRGTLDLGLPKFTLNYAIQLNDVLNTMGMPTAFTNRADFTKINAKGGLLLSLIKQNTFCCG